MFLHVGCWSNVCLLFLQIAITGKSFFKASTISTELIINNILRIGRVNVIGDVILFLGKLCVSLASALFAFFMLDTHKFRSAHNKISSPLFPVLVCLEQGKHNLHNFLNMKFYYLVMVQ